MDDPHSASHRAAATEAAQRALSLDPRNSWARSTRFMLELDAWDWRGAASDLRIIRTGPYRDYLGILSIYFQAMGFPEESLATFRRRLSFDPDPDHPEARPSRLLYLLELTGRYQELIRVTRAALAQRPHDLVALTDLCQGYAAAHRMAEAQAVEEQLKPRQAEFWSRGVFQDCEIYIHFFTGNLAGFRSILQLWESEFPDEIWDSAAVLGNYYVRIGDFDKASEWFERGYERRELGFFDQCCFGDLEFKKRMAEYRLTVGYKALAAKPLFKEWQAEHDRIAAALAAHRDPLATP